MRASCHSDLRRHFSADLYIVNLYYFQIFPFEDYRAGSNENRIKLASIALSGGIIYARNSAPRALNRTICQLELLLRKVDNLV
ncbi:MAG: hypothetical protein ACTXOO_01305 [Sodalis sp. (in: enterobacteria)]